jgi:hypothetical protein
VVAALVNGNLTVLDDGMPNAISAGLDRLRRRLPRRGVR